MWSLHGLWNQFSEYTPALKKKKKREWKSIREHHISKGKYYCYVTFVTVICTGLQLKLLSFCGLLLKLFEKHWIEPVQNYREDKIKCDWDRRIKKASLNIRVDNDGGS